MSGVDGGRGRGFVPDLLTELFQTPLDPGYADAAARRAAVGPRRGWRRRAARGLTAVSMAAVGFLLVLAYQKTVEEEPSRSQARAGLVAQVTQRQAETDELQARADTLRDEVARQRDAALEGSQAADLRDLEAAAGLARVRGDGVVVRLADGPETVDPVTGQGQVNELGRVLDRDLQDVANALWGAGAEAVSVNGQRLTSTSTIRAAGSAILVDFRPLTGPYEVSAIGPGQLADDFRSSQVAALLRMISAEHGLSIEVRSAEDLVLPAAGEPQLRYARAAPSGPPAADGADPSVTTSGGPR
ncbi:MULTISPECIES: DUF881 domain-containing protein [unclassified Solwaraspora]|uniref:DUF881 domain-containing protein n=1 Tax=unclassified Solwaraspora TaxID=2627926 RepID=UPI00259B3749|nr:DUF881 domain-containing protein [Solwaraspora sp. WMMA2056]WJK38895.1 DUF881 domain-containing protein [Solwaraspora sp. WMMA2056]